MSNKEIRVLKGCELWILRGGLTVLWSEGIPSTFGVSVFDGLVGLGVWWEGRFWGSCVRCSV